LRQLGKALTVSRDCEFFAGIFFGVVIPHFYRGVARSCAFFGMVFCGENVVS
jgi:hypothetical protein